MPLKSLNLGNCSGLTNEGLEYLRGLPLVRLNIAGCSAYLDPLHGMPLTSLNMELCTNVQSLEGLQGLPLTKLNLALCGLADPLLEHLKGLPLIDLNLAHCDELTGEGLAHLWGMSLTSLNLGSCTKMGDSDLGYLRGMPLTSLTLDHCCGVDGRPMYGDFFSSLLAAPLQKLSIVGTYIEPKFMWYCQYLPITDLDMSYCYNFGLKWVGKIF